LNRLRLRVRESPSYRWWALWILLAGFFSTGISITILTAVLPDIAREFHVGSATIAWVVTAPMLVTGVLTPTMGKACDLYGRKRIYLWGWMVATIFAGLAAVSWSAGTLIAFRVLGAAAGAATGPASMALILESFEPHERATALGWWSFMGAGAPVIGLVAGGPLVDLVGWRWLFGIQPPLAAGGLVLSWFLLKDDAPGTRRRFDVAGSVTLGLAVGCVLYALNRGGAGGWAGVDVLAAFALAPVLVLLFVRAERRHPEPLIPLAYLRRRNVTVPVLVEMVAHVPYMGCFFISPFFLHAVLHYDNARTSLALMPRPLANAVLSLTAGYVVVRVGERVSAVTGMAVLAAGMLVLASLGSQASFMHVSLAQALTGAGLGLSYPGLASTVANAVEVADFGTISALQNMAWTVGAVAGMQGLQTFQSVRARTVGSVASFREVFALAAVIAIGALFMATAVRPMRRARTAPEARVVVATPVGEA
jgi:EmrB/QacA subfamily drug resistance transporter